MPDPGEMTFLPLKGGNRLLEDRRDVPVSIETDLRHPRHDSLRRGRFRNRRSSLRVRAPQREEEDTEVRKPRMA